MPASTSGKPVRPWHQASKRCVAGSSDRAAIALLVLAPSVGGEVQQHLGEEVPPAELAAVRVALRRRRQPRFELARGDAAEVQVGRQARGTARRPRSFRPSSYPATALRRKACIASRPARSPPLAGSATSASGPAPRATEPDRRRGRAAAREPSGQAHSAGAGRDPGAMEWPEHRVWAAVQVSIAAGSSTTNNPSHGTSSRPACRSARATVSARLVANGDTSLLANTSEAPASRASAASSCSGLPRRITSPLPRSRNEVFSSARDSSRNCVRGPDAWRPEQPVVATEHRHDALVTIERGAEPRVVVHAQVAGEPHQRGHRLTRARSPARGRCP